MRRITFDLDILRTYVTGIELGSFAKAADRLGRSTSAVSAQLKKLEEQLGTPVLRKAGRGMLPTAAGEALLGYARRLLELNDEAATAVRGVELAGSVRLGMQEDFAEHILTDMLGRFARAHPRLRIEARVARSAELLEQMAAGRLDLALAWDGDGGSRFAGSGFGGGNGSELGADAGARRAAGWRGALDIGPLPMRWIGAADLAPPTPGRRDEPLPLVVFDAPCLMRSAATNALDRAGIAWRVAFTSPSLGGVWAAVAAGLGVTVRTDIGVPAQLRVLEDCGLPPLPDVGLLLHHADAAANPVIERLRDIVLHTLAQHAPAQRAA
ncbi:LysR substrate-binding domain-containing protein [Rugamonas sp. CCM 8940]|uniref:LysR substrate-binding domain-containing protein n=1 Tax=Rugamonas sp. CCM 8940 TaxID=2765359 RepID=UPI0018F5DDC2|nr:LysR substrate-binding domain-containing protein [Rugamonas sp. CCM 8940]MBJ7311874.1 LysR family transcriptional regulator [Rugamonas sp. CCM 8940]